MKLVQLIAICAFGCPHTGCGHVLQEYTLPTAHARTARWSDQEIALIKATLDRPLSLVARALGRTYYGTARARTKVKRGILST